MLSTANRNHLITKLAHKQSSLPILTHLPRKSQFAVLCTLTSTAIYILHRVIHKSLRDFRPLLYSSRNGHAEGEHVNGGRDTPSFCPTLQVLDMSTLGVVNPVIKFLPHTCNVCGRNLITGLTSAAVTKGGHIEHL